MESNRTNLFALTCVFVLLGLGCTYGWHFSPELARVAPANALHESR